MATLVVTTSVSMSVAELFAGAGSSTLLGAATLAVLPSEPDAPAATAHIAV